MAHAELDFLATCNFARISNDKSAVILRGAQFAPRRTSTDALCTILFQQSLADSPPDTPSP